MPHAQQLSLVEDVVALTELAPDLGADYGEVFTRRWVVDFILDLVGYTADKDLGAVTLIEPSCGTGAFLVPVVERLIESSAAHGRDLGALGSAIRAFDLLDANAERARKAVAGLLTNHGLHEDEAGTLVGGWVNSGDFLLHPHEAAGADYVVGNPPYIRLENISRPTMDAYRRICPTMRGRADIYIGFIERGLGLLKPGGALSYICADRWMRNQYGADLRELIASEYAVDTVISMHDVDAFEDDVSAYPAIVVIRNGPQAEAVVVDANDSFGASDVPHLTAWARRGRRPSVGNTRSRIQMKLRHQSGRRSATAIFSIAIVMTAGCITNPGDFTLTVLDGSSLTVSNTSGDPILTVLLEPPCGDGADNDLDEAADYPADADCASAGDANERLSGSQAWDSPTIVLAIDAAGVITVDPADISFPQTEICPIRYNGSPWCLGETLIGTGTPQT